MQSGFDPINTPIVDETAVSERVASFAARSLKKHTKINALRLAMSMIDLTTLEGKDTEGKIEQMCYKALHPCDELGLPSVAAICVYPSYVKRAKKHLGSSAVKVASVSTGFPSGNTDTSIKLDETRMAVGHGADEIDMVISRGKFLQGEYDFVFDEIAAVKQACGTARLKVILETGELGTLRAVRKASDLAISAGADFIKTSTGKIQPAVTMPVTLVMMEAVQDHYLKTGKMIGIKPAGGISNSKTALQYLVMLYETLGEKWLSNQWFRFGASSLANDIILQLGKEEKGAYFSRDYISID
jgi:deoxyribose-phosphate aldolase